MLSQDHVRFAAVGDIHCKKDSAGAFRELVLTEIAACGYAVHGFDIAFSAAP